MLFTIKKKRNCKKWGTVRGVKNNLAPCRRDLRDGELRQEYKHEVKIFSTVILHFINSVRSAITSFAVRLRKTENLCYDLSIVITYLAALYVWVGIRGGAVGWGTALQAGRSRVRIPMMSSFWPQYDHGVDSASNRNEYQEYFLGVKAAGA